MLLILVSAHHIMGCYFRKDLISNVLHMCIMSYKIILPHFYVKHRFFHEISQIRCLLPIERIFVFLADARKFSFLAAVFINPPFCSVCSRGSAQGCTQAGDVQSLPVCHRWCSQPHSTVWLWLQSGSSYFASILPFFYIISFHMNII